jgi:inorganic pyrophosphatase
MDNPHFLLNPLTFETPTLGGVEMQKGAECQEEPEIYEEIGEIPVYVEIEKHTNVKYELNKEAHKLEIDRVLPYPYFYPYSYGFIPNTCAEDGDELDALIFSRNSYPKDIIVKTHIIGALIMEDEKGIDHKLFCVPVNEIEDFCCLTKAKLCQMFDDIAWFFSNYKSKEKKKWSKVHGVVNYKTAIEIYQKCLL